MNTRTVSKIVISNSHSAVDNQAAEFALFQDLQLGETVLFLWTNAPSIVYGRHQNPWREIDVPMAEASRITLLRRISGGGTVYHDLGNINFSFMTSHSHYDEGRQFQIIMNAMKGFGIDLELTKRKDLLCDGYKVSGNAFYLKGNRRMHHGTLLINAKLDQARALLKASDASHLERFKQQRSIPSVHSSVMNLSEKNASLTPEKAINAIVDAYYQKNAYAVETIGMKEVNHRHHQAIIKAKDHFSTWSWNFGETPDFAFSIKEAMDITVNNGFLQTRGIDLDPQTLTQLENMNFRR